MSEKVKVLTLNILKLRIYKQRATTVYLFCTSSEKYLKIMNCFYNAKIKIPFYP